MKNLLWGLFAFATLAHAQGTVTDIDGNTYDYLTYGTQQWTVENAAMETYRDGTPIPQVTDATQWSNLTTGAWCYYDNDPTKGKLYNWYAVAGIHDNDPNTPNKEFAPSGWHVPTDAEWTTLQEYLIANGYNYDGTTTGNKIGKSMASISGWISSPTEGSPGNDQSLNNSSDFNVYPYGVLDIFRSEKYVNEGMDAFIWSSTEYDTNQVWISNVPNNYSYRGIEYRNKKFGCSVRLLKNNNTCSEVSINASATEVCAGESVDLTVSSGLTAGTTACTSADLPANLQTGLVGYWPFCGNANDESGNGNNGTVNGATLTTDRFGNSDSAYNFDSVDDFLTIDSNNNQLDFYGNCCITISGWINIENTNNQYGIFTNSGYNLNHQQYALKVDANNKLYFLSGNGLFEANGINYSTSSVEPNQWTHTAVTYDGSTLKLYLNGNLEFENQIVDYFPESPSETVFIGNSWGANNELFPGDIDDLAIWNRALSASEIQQLVNSFNHTSSFNDYEFFGEFQGSAYYVSTNPVDFSTASNFNSDNGVSFLTITSEQENNFLASGSLPGFLWLGCSDLNSEGDWNWLNGESFNYSNWDSGEPNNQVGGEDYAEFRTTGFWNDIPLFALNGDEVLRYHMFETTQFSSIVWSTGDTTENITVTPTETTEYWVDVTTNGVTCREYVTINVTAPAAPTGPLTQSFCDTATIADLTATGDNIQWYDSATGGNLLNSTTALTDGQMVYASQTVNGCESTDRLEVTVSIQDITLTASATEVCAGETITITAQSLGLLLDNKFCSKNEIPITLHDSLLGAWPFCGNPNDVSGNNFNGTINGGVSLGESRFGDLNDSYIFDGQPLTYISMGTHESLDITQGSISISCWVDVNNVGGTKTILSKANNDTSNLFGSYNLHINGDTNFVVTNSTNTNGFYSLTNGSPTYGGWLNIIAVADINDLKLRLYLDGLLVSEIDWEGTYKGGLQEFLIGSHYKSNFGLQYMYNFNGSIDDVAIWNRVLNQYEVDYLSMTNFSTYTWSTGDTTANISVTPTETTEYWVDVTTNGVTCREYVTINVTAPAAPTGPLTQSFCDTATIADLTATGDNIQWYDSATGGNLLDSTTALTDGQMVYASQTVNGCESTDRLEVTVSIQDITITASATEVCAGESVDLGVTYPQQFNSWTHMVAVYNLDTDLLYFYINGVLRATSDISGIGNIYLTGGGSGSRKIGARAYSNQPDIYFWGDIDDVGVWDKPLSDIQVTDLYENQNICQVMDLPLELQSDLIAYYPFCNSLVDIGGGHNGTNFGATASTDRFGNVNSSFHFDGTSYVSIPTSLNLNNTSGGWTLSAWANPDFIANNIPNANYILDLTDGTANNNWGDRTALGLVVDGYRTGSHADNNISTNYEVTAPFATPPSILWSTGDTSETISVTPTETTEYWVDVTTNGVTCREYVTISVNDLPEAPTGETVNYFINCDSFSPTLNDVIATLTGDNIKLYDAAVGGNLLDPNSNIIDGQVVYASQTLDSCESSDRLEVQLNLYVLDTPVTDAPNNTVSFCNEQNLTILDLAPAQTATDRLWYETATSTTPIAETTPLVDGVTYYVSNYDIETGCESDRLAMTVEINNPEAPTGDAVQSFCDNVSVSDLSASGSNIQWYDAATGGNVLDPSSTLSDGQVLYASQTENSCESITRLEVSVEIDIIPDPILITTELEFCLAREATLVDLEVDEQGFALEWYDSFSGGNMLPMDTLLEDGVSYYATLYDAASGCESLMRLEVVPTVIPCEVVIYNAISLNDNGINDYMVIENAEYFPDNSLEVYNRDGHLLYSQTQYGIGDNLFRGVANVSGIYGSTLSGDGPRLPTGSYLYVFKYFNPYEQQQYTLKGFLTINSN